MLRAALHQAEADVAVAQAKVSQARLNLSYTRIVAPVDGMVGQRSVRLGAYVNAGTRLLAVVPLHQTYITANYLETQLAKVQQGQKVLIKIDAMPGKSLLDMSIVSLLQPAQRFQPSSQTMQRVTLLKSSSVYR